MSNKMLDKFLGFIGFEEAENEVPEKVLEKPVTNSMSLKEKERHELVAISGRKQSCIVSTQPKEFNDVQGIADHLKAGNPIIVNFSEVEPEESRRILDYICGVTYALNGSGRKVGNDIFLFAPPFVEIVEAGEVQNTRRTRQSDDDSIAWLKSVSA